MRAYDKPGYFFKRPKAKITCNECYEREWKTGTLSSGYCQQLFEIKSITEDTKDNHL